MVVLLATVELMDCMCNWERMENRKRIPLEGEVPSPIDPPSGCKFRPRCAYATDKCAQEIPAWEEAAPGHFVACHHWRNV